MGRATGKCYSCDSTNGQTLTAEQVKEMHEAGALYDLPLGKKKKPRR